MYKEIVVDVGQEQTVVAVLEDGSLMEVYLEHEMNKRVLGNIYKGIVENVLPGMQAAFVDIGLERNAFLYVDEAINFPTSTDMSIRDVVKEGQELLVQVIKEPLGTKGARVTTKITLPGRFIVLMPTVDYVGVSRRIEDENERERLKELANEVKYDSMGVIVRTVAEGAGYAELKRDFDTLATLWQKISAVASETVAPQIVHKDLELVQRMVRDILTEDVNRMLINSREIRDRILEYVEIAQPEFKNKVFYQEGDFLEKYNINSQIRQALRRKVWLKNGAYIVIDQMEALTAIDVNTGKFVGKDNLKETVFETNLQAVTEIVRQLRLRNIGGIIVIDFIDMKESEHKQMVLAALEKELKKDRTKTSIMGITQLGLVEMTRKKTRQGLESILMSDCPYCDGKGKVLTDENIVLNIKRKIRECASRTIQSTIVVKVHPQIANFLEEDQEVIEKLENEINKKIIIKDEKSFHLEDVELITT
ncbi:MAG: ribonuclease [Clostridia bacterium]|jgi:ribonuclease G|nr:ribonuclease, Rne/Rng family [Clostridiales bacterium]MDK2984482.1 ribonuclease [Clostridia bacterium]